MLAPNLNHLQSNLQNSLQNGFRLSLKTGLLASVALVSAAAGFLGDRPAQASTYGPLPIISAEQLGQDTCYLRDENGLVIDLTALCDGGRGTILPTVSVSQPYRRVAQSESSFRTRIKVNTAEENPVCQNCKPPVIQITGGKNLEAIQELSAPPSNPYGNLGI